MPLYQTNAVTLSNTALVAQVPDNAIAGGNARGANAVDLQQFRAAATQVASASASTIGGGESNTASGIRSTVAGGNLNAAGGVNAFVGGGGNNTASGVQSTIAGGSTNTAAGSASWVPGGLQGTTRGIAGRGAWSSGRITTNGDNQSGEHQLGRQTTDATATRLTADGAAAGTTNQINLPNYASYAGLLIVTAKATGTTDAAHWFINCGAVRGANAAATTVQGGGTALAPTLSSGTGSAWRIDVTADTTNGALAITATGAAATTIVWSVRYANVEASTAS